MQGQSRWINQSQPQTLVYATMFAYFGAFFSLIGSTARFAAVADFILGPLIGIAGCAALAASGWGLANEKKWGYYLSLAMVGIEVLSLLLFVQRFGLDLSNLIWAVFAACHVGFLVHPQSREYVRIWFK